MKKLILLFLIFFFLPHTDAKACEDPVAGIAIAIDNLEQLREEVQKDIPMPFIYQAYTYSLCKKYEVDYELALAVMDKESEWQVKAFNRNDNGSVDKGLMQINSCNYDWLREELGITDFYNPWQNIECGVFILSNLSGKYTNLNQILMSYNMGERRTRELRKKGIYSSAYSRKVVTKIFNLKRDKPS